MRKLSILLIVLLAPLVALLAQPTILIEDATACTNDNFCVEVTAEDFTNINSLDFNFGYNSDVLTFTGAQNFNTEMQTDGNLGPALFDGSTPGVVEFGVWETGDCLDPSNFGVTLPDEEVLFELCFEAVGGYGDQSEIAINPIPTPLCTRNSTGCANIGLLREDGEVTLCVREFNVTASDVTGNEGDQVCIDFVVDGWDDLNGIQFTVNYDPAFLQFEDLFPNTEITSNTLAAYGTPPDVSVPGAITVAYSYTIPDPSSISVVDGTTFFTACFTIVGACETGTLITFSDNPTPIQVNNEDPDNPDENSVVPVSLNPGSVLVNDCDPEGIEIKIDCGPPVDVNDVVCVEFQAGTNFDDVRRMVYLMSWNPNVLEFIEVNSAGNLGGLSIANDFDDSNVANGILGLDYESTPVPAQNLDDMEAMYEICFNVIGVGGDSPVQISTPGIGVSGGVNIGINPFNCVVEVNEPESVVISFGSTDTPLGGTDCIPVTVGNFNEVLSAQFTMNWDETIWLYNGTVQNVNAAIAGASPTFTPVGASSLGFTMDSGTPITLPDDAVLFEVCFDTAPTAAPGDCSELTTVGLPFPESAITANSNGENIGLIVNTGDLCVLFPDGFGLEAVSTTGDWLDTICMDFTVESFDNITAAEFNVVWDVAELQFVSATPLAWTNLILTPAPVGTMNAVYDSPIPEPIPDGEVAFEVCFALIGDPNECYDVEIQNEPSPQVTTTVGPGSIVITNGEICVEERIVLTDIVVTQPSCPGACDGAIDLTVAEWEGQGFIGTTWTFDYPPFMDFVPEMLDDVCEGRVIFTVFDNNSGVNLTDTVFLVSDGEVPEAIINGEEIRELDCDGGLVPLTTSSAGDGLTANWYYNTTSSEPFGMGPSVFADDPGCVILEIVNQITGCSATDSVKIITPGAPVAVIDDVDEIFDCNTGSIMLNGGNSMGENLVYTWELQVNGEFVVVGAGEMYEATEPGTYRLTVENAVTGCPNDVNDPDAVVVIENGQTAPLACAELAGGGSNVQEQNCDGTPITFSAECSDLDGQIVSYDWYEYDPTSGEFGTAFGNGIEESFTELGDYAVEIINLETGCADTAFVQIVPNTSAPEVSIDLPPAFDCNTESIVLNGSFSPNDPTFTFEWVVTNGGSFEPGTETLLQPTALMPGAYRLIVTNPDNMCVGDSTVVIEDLTTPPTIEITNDPTELALDCVDATEITLLTAAEEDVVYQWFLTDTNMGSEIEGATEDSLVVNVGGVYIVQVTNPATGCTNTAMVTVTDDFETPMIVLSETEAELTCTDSTITVMATVTGSTDFTLGDWTSTPATAIDDATISPDGATITIRTAGTYNIPVVSNSSGCDSEADVVITLNNTPPIASVLTDTLTINCLADTISLSGAGSSTGQDFTYLWENLSGGDGPFEPTELVTDTDTPGTYLLTVTDESNGCTADTTVMVGTDLEGPMLSIAPVDPITCDDPTRDLTVEVIGADVFTIMWSDGTPLDELTTTVDTTGTFTVTVVNDANGCESTAEVTVDGDVEEPEVIIAEPAQFDCPDEFVLLDGSATGDAADFTDIQWSFSGSPLTGENDLTHNAMMLGTYELSVTSTANGCTGTAEVTVEPADELTLPQLPMLSLDLLGCDGDPVTIDASAADDGTDFLSVDWSTLDGEFTIGANAFIIEATAAGTYTLEVTVNSPVMGCTNSMDYTVELDPDTPVADAGDDQVAGCGDPAELDATGSTPPSATVTYTWTAEPGSEPLTGDLTGPNPMAEGAGTYVLTVTNTDNGCEATDTVSVTFELPMDASAGVDASACDDVADLSGNQPANTTGVWTTTTGATIDMPTNSVTMVSDLSQGANLFTWTLSAPGCPDYSSDDVIVTRAAAPTAMPDMLEMEFGQLTGTVSLIANDIVGPSGFEITILTPPAFGTFDTTALNQGDFVLTVAPNTFGVTQVTYQICSKDCPDLCSTSVIDIVVLPGDETFVPNTITPNGDGANDNLVFDILLFNPADEFPDNEIIIFNRWGDIIYEATPYNNDWNGLSQDGTPVAEGTYYFVLRLNISKGEIIRGDVTVIR